MAFEFSIGLFRKGLACLLSLCLISSACEASICLRLSRQAAVSSAYPHSSVPSDGVFQEQALTEALAFALQEITNIGIRVRNLSPRPEPSFALTRRARNQDLSPSTALLRLDILSELAESFMLEPPQTTSALWSLLVEKGLPSSQAF